MAELLLRLFHSDYFSPHLALSYLKNYSENIGITYYLVDQLQTAFEASDVEFYWPQLCHLLLTKPSDSLALENFVLRRCSESVHIALVTLWHMQAARFDLSANPNTPSFQVCKRVINRCQSILFDDAADLEGTQHSLQAPFLLTGSGDAGAGPSGSGSGGANETGGLLGRIYGNLAAGLGERISPANALTTVVGVGSAIGAVGQPRLTSIGGPIAVAQGRKPPDDAMRRALRRIEQDGEEGDYDEEYEEQDEDTEQEADLQPDQSKSSVRIFAPGEAIPPHMREGSSASGSSHASTPAASLRRGSTPDASAGDKSAGASTPATEKALPPPPGASSSATALTPTQAQTPPQRSPGRFASFTSSLGEFRDRAAAAVGDAIGQHFQIVAPPNQKPAGRTSLGPHSPQRQARVRGAPKDDSSIRRASVNSHSTPNLARGNVPHSAPGGQARFVSSAALVNSQSFSSVTSLVSHYTPAMRARLLRVHYSRTQTDFLAALQDISARLLLLPKPARLSALRAELTDLNHSLPKEVCFPLWCQCSKDSIQRPQHGHKKQGSASGVPAQPATAGAAAKAQLPPGARHHRVVRINPSESVVLNSADRAPYLLHVEVLNNDLDFDPDRRVNREVLKKLIAKDEDQRRRQWKRGVAEAAGEDARAAGSMDGSAPPSIRKEAGALSLRQEDATPLAENKQLGDAITPPGSSEMSREASSSGHAQARSGAQETDRSAEPGPSKLSIATSDVAASRQEALPPEGDEGVDLTEQAYGADLGKFGGDGDESDEEDLAIMNRHHDSAAWTAFRSREGSLASVSNGSTHAPDSPTTVRKQFSLDDYSERMRTAAIMLAQLNQSTNAGAHPIVTHNPHVTATAQGGWSSWIIGTSWAGSSGPQKSEPGQASAGIPASINMAGGSASAGSSSTPSSAPRTPSMPMGGGSGPGGNVRLMHADAESIRKRIMQEMMALEEERMSRTKVSARTAVGSGIEDEATVMRAVNKDDPSAAIFRESWAAKKARIRAASPYGHLPNWDVFSVIVKTDADLRQEQLAVQLVNEFGRIFEDTKSRCWVRYFRILVTSENSGLMETITDAISVHSIKKEAYSQQVGGENIATYSLYDHFVSTYGPTNSAKFKRAQDNFLQSLAGYSIISYLLQIKDRHNGNILVDDEGHLIHIDFGFMLGISPGGVGFEAAPFKMPQEYIDILGGMDSAKFREFRELMRQGFKDVRKHAERIIMIVELMQKDSKLPCFALAEETATNLRNRFQLALSASQCDDFVDKLIISSAGSAFTRLYDQFQYYSQGIL